MQVLSIAHSFPIQGNPIRCIQYGHGHINTTYKIETDCDAAYILQRINQHVFRHPIQLMENAFAITQFLRQKQNAGSVLQFLPTLDGSPCYKDGDGEFWRMYHFIPGKTLEQIEKLEDFYRCGLGFGNFQMLLADFPAETLHETIPNFHNTVQRFHQVRASVEADTAGRRQEISEEIDYLYSMEQRAGTLQRMLQEGLLPLRVTHNDTKLSNLLFDEEYRPICVLDLDTVMPGLSAMDFADAIRSGAATAAEDEPDTTKMCLDLDRFRAFATGFLEAATTLTPAEVDSLAEGALVITLEQAARFLKDHLDGDVYYHIHYSAHNLVRARAQIKLAQDMWSKMNEMKQIIADIQEKIKKQ